MAGPADVASGDPAGAGPYLTNDVFLYRVVRIATSETGEVVELEDCYLLDVTLRADRRRPRTPAPRRDRCARQRLSPDIGRFTREGIGLAPPRPFEVSVSQFVVAEQAPHR